MKQHKDKGTTGTGPGAGRISRAPELRFVKKEVLQLQAENKKLREQLKQQNSNSATEQSKDNKMEKFQIQFKENRFGASAPDVGVEADDVRISTGTPSFIGFYQEDVPVAIYNGDEISNIRKIYVPTPRPIDPEFKPSSDTGPSFNCGPL